MKILVISDTHFGPKVDGRLDKLKELIFKYDKVIINGDFFERYLQTFDQFINSGWSELFPLLKSKDAVYIYGNHDKKEFSDERTSLFSNFQGDSYELTSGNKTFHFTHGHLFHQGVEEKYKAILYVKPLTAFVFFGGNLIYRTGIYFLFPFARRMNKRIYNSWMNKGEDKILICGHSHLATISEDKRYFNSGLIRWNYFSYIEIEDGEIKLKADIP